VEDLILPKRDMGPLLWGVTPLPPLDWEIDLSPAFFRSH